MRKMAQLSILLLVSFSVLSAMDERLAESALNSVPWSRAALAQLGRGEKLLLEGPANSGLTTMAMALAMRAHLPPHYVNCSQPIQPVWTRDVAPLIESAAEQVLVVLDDVDNLSSIGDPSDKLFVQQQWPHVAENHFISVIGTAHVSGRIADALRPSFTIYQMGELSAQARRNILAYWIERNGQAKALNDISLRALASEVHQAPAGELQEMVNHAVEAHPGQPLNTDMLRAIYVLHHHGPVAPLAPAPAPVMALAPANSKRKIYIIAGVIAGATSLGLIGYLLHDMRKSRSAAEASQQVAKQALETAKSANRRANVGIAAGVTGVAVGTTGVVVAVQAKKAANASTVKKVFSWFVDFVKKHGPDAIAAGRRAFGV